MSEQISRKELEAKLIKKLWSDEVFRKEFEANPQAVISKAFNIPLDQAPKIVLHAEMANEWHIVVPHKPASTVELSDDELEQVAGGVMTDIPTTKISNASVTSNHSADSFARYPVAVGTDWG